MFLRAPPVTKGQIEVVEQFNMTPENELDRTATYMSAVLINLSKNMQLE